MKKQIRIAIIGDYNFTFNSHHATNLSLDHAAYFLEIEINYYWIKLHEATSLTSNQLKGYDGVWISSGPYKNEFLLSGIIELLTHYNLPVLITGEGFKRFFELLISKKNLSANGEKLISDNLISNSTFDKIELIPHSNALIQLYKNHNKIELTTTRYSLYPSLLKNLTQETIQIEAYNEFEDVEIVSLNNKNFFVVCGYCPQISSTRDIPHPLIYTFIKACYVIEES
jgi:CTP synthase (UTP-ammonia lyase)